MQQTTEPQYPEILLIGLNKNGVMLIDPSNKVGKVLDMSVDADTVYYRKFLILIHLQ